MDRIAPPLIRSPRVRVRVIYAYEKSYSRERFFFCCALRNVNPGSFNMQVYNIEWEPKNMTKGFVDVKGSWLLVYLPLLIELMEEYYCERSKNLDKLTRLVTNIKAHGHEHFVPLLSEIRMNCLIIISTTSWLPTNNVIESKCSCSTLRIYSHFSNQLINVRFFSSCQ